MGKKLILLFLPFLCALADQEYRNWTNKQGKSIEARFIKFTKEKFEIRRKDGRTFTMTSDMYRKKIKNFWRNCGSERIQGVTFGMLLPHHMN